MTRNAIRLRLVQIGADWRMRRCGTGYLVRHDRRGRALVYLGRGHRLADKSGQAYVGRFVLGMATGQRLPTWKHCHHRDHDRGHDALGNYEVLPAGEHSRLHAARQARGADGRFRRAAEAVAA